MTQGQTNDQDEVASHQGLRPETIAVTNGRPTESGASLNHPIHLASNFRHGGPTGSRDYARGDGTDSIQALERTVAQLESGGATTIDAVGLAYGSGMAAVSAVLDLLPVGASVLAPDDCYQGVAAALDHAATHLDWTVRRLPTSDTSAWLAAINESTPDLVWVESPSNPLLTIADVPAICTAAAQQKVLVAVDNTFATPLLQRPLEHGATFAIHSATKFMGGHSDLLAGMVVVSDDDLAERLRYRRMLLGANIGSLEAFLVLRGLRTLPVRLERSQTSAQMLAERLASSPVVTAVHYPGLSSHHGFELAKRTLDGPGAVLSFETTGSAADTDRALAALDVIVPATSLGGVESTAERRARLEGQESIPESLVRLSVGCEHVEDLWADLLKFLDSVGRQR